MGSRLQPQPLLYIVQSTYHKYTIMTTKNDKYLAGLFLRIMLPFIGVMLIAAIGLLFLTGCNAEKRATRKAERKHDKSVRLDPMVAARYCAARYSPIDSVNERIIYKPGRTIYDTILTTEIEIFNDTVYLKEVKVVTVTKHDTIDRTRFERAAFKAALDTMKGYYEGELKKSAEAISDRDKKIASQATTIKYLWGAGGIAWALIIVWVIKKVWWR